MRNVPDFQGFCFALRWIHVTDLVKHNQVGVISGAQIICILICMPVEFESAAVGDSEL